MLSRQESYRQLYRRLNPAWHDSVSVYRDVVDSLITPDTWVLDVGCGHSDLLRGPYSKTPHTYGVDPEADALARNTVIRNKTVVRADDLPFDDGTFDLVVSAWVLEHLDDPHTVFREFHRVLKPGGKVVFLTPNAWNYNVWLIRLVPNALHDFLTRRLYGRQEHDTFPVRYRANTPPRIATLAAAAGFRKVNLILNGDPTYIAFNRPLFHFSRMVERSLSTRPLRAARVHIIGVYEKPNGDGRCDTDLGRVKNSTA